MADRKILNNEGDEAVLKAVKMALKDNPGLYARFKAIADDSSVEAATVKAVQLLVGENSA